MKYIDEACWDGYQKRGMKKKGDRMVPNCIKEAEGFCEQCLIEYIREAYSTDKPEFIEIIEPGLNEAEYQGRTVQLGKPMQGNVKKFKVYVKNDKGNVVKVNFGDPNMRIRKSNPARRRSFRARHRCETPGPRWKARYWSCRKW